MVTLLLLQLAGFALPNPVTTPGALNPAVSWKTADRTICRANWTATVRPPAAYTTHLKRQQLGAGANLRAFEEDHLIPLTLGGDPRSPLNLWPQPIREARQKDVLEQTLHRGVCAGRIDLADAQRSIAADWIKAYRKYVESR